MDAVSRLRTMARRLPFRAIGRWAGIVCLGAALSSVVIWGIFQVHGGWKADVNRSVSCNLPFGATQPPFSYLQFNIKEQAVEPYFRGGIFMSLGDIPSGPPLVKVTTTGQGHYANTVTEAHFVRNEFAQNFWMTNESTEVPFYRVAGSLRNFPFDSGTIDFDTSFDPPLRIDVLMIRNLNPGFDVPCATARATRDNASGRIHVSFELRRNRLVQLVATFLLAGSLFFVLIIPFTVKPDALATSVASFFFAMWSIRGILTPETKVFPTLLDLCVLLLSVLLLILLVFNFFLRWIRPRKA